MRTLVPLLAHIGEPGDVWIGIVTVSGAVVLIIFLLVLADVVTIESPGDLLLPLAVVILFAGLAGTLGEAIDEQGPWLAPLGLVLLAALIVAGMRGGMDLGWRSRPTLVTLGIAAVVVAGAYGPLNDLWFPQEARLPALADARVVAELVSPPDEDGRFTVEISLTEGATIGRFQMPDPEDDVEQGLLARFQVGPIYLQPPTPSECAEQDVCTTATYELTLPSGFITEVPDSITVEMLTATGLPFSPPMIDTFDLPSGG